MTPKAPNGDSRSSVSAIGHISRGAISTIVLEVAALALGYIWHVLLARWLGAADYGRYAFVVSFAFLLMVPLQIGLDIGFLRFFSQYVARRDWPRASGFLRRGFAIPLGLAVPCSLAIVVAGLALGNEWDYGYPLAIGILALPALLASSLILHAGRALGRFAVIKSMQDVGRPLLLLWIVMVMAWIGLPLTSQGVLLIFTCAALAVACIQALALYRLLPDAIHKAPPRYATRLWLRTSIPFLMTTGTAVIMQQSDVLMLGLFTSASDVGIYSVAVKFSRLVTLTLVGVNMLAAPTYAILFAQNARHAMQNLARVLAHVTFWPAVAVTCLLFWGGPWLLSWFGPGFANGYLAMMILALAGVVDVGVGSVGYMANMADQQRAAARIRGIAALINIVLNAALIPNYGLTGAACATALSVALVNVWLHALITRRVGIKMAIIFAFR